MKTMKDLRLGPQLTVEFCLLSSPLSLGLLRSEFLGLRALRLSLLLHPCQQASIIFKD